MSTLLIRLFKLFFGTLLLALGVVLTMRANLGYASWEVFHWGIVLTIGSTLGIISILASIVIVVIVLIMGEKLGFGTVVSIILMGIFLDVIIFLDFIPQMKHWFSGLLMMVSGLFVMAFGVYYYIGSAFGAGPRDSFMVALRRKTGLPIGVCRIFLESFVTLVGWLLGGPFGVGTVIAAFGTGACIQIVFNLMKFEATAVKHETMDVTLRNLKEMWRGYKDRQQVK